MTTRIELSVPNGRKAAADLALPEGAGRAPAVIVVHEWWGLNDDMRRMAERFAAEGFVALSVDLFGGRVAADAGEAMALVQAMKTPEAMDVVRGAVSFLGEHPRGGGKIGVTGFCLGGAMALAAACSVEGLSAAVPFYGIPLPQHADYSRVRIPIQGHYAEKDGIIPTEKPRAVEAAVRAGGGDMQLFLYDAGHAFMRERDAAVYDEPSARLAWSRAVEFFREKLA